jgi:hypothetical protein
VFDNLYEDSKRRSSARVARTVSSLSPEHTFRPDINLSQKKMLGSSRMTPMKKKNALFTVEPLVDPKTNQPLFTPLINKKHSIKRNDSAIKLYESKNNSLSKKISKNKPKLVSKQKTKELISNMRSTTFKAIFEMLDLDKDGIVHTEYIDESSIEFINQYRISKGSMGYI